MLLCNQLWTQFTELFLHIINLILRPLNPIQPYKEPIHQLLELLFLIVIQFLVVFAEVGEMGGRYIVVASLI